MTPRARQVAVLGLGIIALAALVLAVTAGLLCYFEHREASPALTRSPLAEPQPLPPEPRLQVAPSADLEELRAEEDARLSSYGWIDREQQVVHIPIDRAMDILLEKGLPVRDQAGEAGQE